MPNPRRLIATLSLLLALAGASAAEARRVALLIANAAYKGDVPPLRNAVQDNSAMARLLGPQGLKFDQVTILTDASGPAMKQALARFAEQAREAEMALVYASGYSNGTNGVPLGEDGLETAIFGTDLTTEAETENAATVRQRSLSDREIGQALQAAQVKGALILIDSMRSGPRPFTAATRSISRTPSGSALPSLPTMYASQPGRTLWEIYALVATEVDEASSGRQRPSRNQQGDWQAVLAPAPK